MRSHVCGHSVDIDDESVDRRAHGLEDPSPKLEDTAAAWIRSLTSRSEDTARIVGCTSVSADLH